MTDVTVSGKMKVKSIKTQFKEIYGIGIRIYKGNSLADDDATIASIRKTSGKDDLTINANMLVKTVENQFKEEFGLRIQLETKEGTSLADDSVTLGSLRK